MNLLHPLFVLPFYSSLVVDEPKGPSYYDEKPGDGLKRVTFKEGTIRDRGSMFAALCGID